MVKQLYRWHCRVIQAQNRIWKAPNSQNSLPRRSACWNLSQVHRDTWYRGSEHCHLLQIWWEIWKESRQIQWNPVESSDQMRGGEWSNRRRIVNWRLWQKVWTKICFRLHFLKIYVLTVPIMCPTWLLQWVFFSGLASELKIPLFKGSVLPPHFQVRRGTCLG